MMPRSAPALSAGALALMLGLAACHGRGGGAKDVDTLDRELVANGAGGDQTDPALTSALEDQIMVDPALTQQKGSAARPGAAPALAPIPAVRPAPGGPAGADAGSATAPAPSPAKAPPAGTTLGELARSQAGPNRPGMAECVRHLQYSVGWAQRLPADLPLYPDAQVSEAAGNDGSGCAVRVVSFLSGASVDRLIDFYYGHGRSAGFAAEHQISGLDHIVAGERGADAFYATFRAQRDGGTQVDLVVNTGR